MGKKETVGSDAKVESIMLLRDTLQSESRRLWHIVRLNAPSKSSKVVTAYFEKLTDTIYSVSGVGGIGEFQVVGTTGTVATPVNSEDIEREEELNRYLYIYTNTCIYVCI